MQYHIRLSVTYHYARPATGGRHLLRLLPLHIPGAQEVAQAAIAISPRPSERAEFTDFFGNRTVEVALTSDHSDIAFTATAKVDRCFAGYGEDSSTPLTGLEAAISACRNLRGEAPHHFLAASPRIHPVAEITAYAREVVREATTTRAAVEALGHALYHDMKFDGSATTVDTPPAEAFAHRHGVCQDFAQIMIAAFRGLGIPAAYVSGFLRTTPPPGRPRLEGADAMHAWVRAWCGPEQGWVEFDPTNDCLIGTNHIVVAYGRDYGDVAPVAGILRVSGKQKTRHAVDVIPLQ